MSDVPQRPEPVTVAEGYGALASKIGMFVIRFAELEHWVNDTITLLLELKPETGEALTSAIFNVSTRLDILNSLIERLDIPDEQRRDLQDLADRTLELNSFRNWVIHEPWMGWSTGGNLAERTYHKARMQRSGKRRKRQRRDFTLSEIEARTSECREASKLALVFINARIKENRKKVTKPKVR